MSELDELRDVVERATRFLVEIEREEHAVALWRSFYELIDARNWREILLAWAHFYSAAESLLKVQGHEYYFDLVNCGLEFVSFHLRGGEEE